MHRQLPLHSSLAGLLLLTSFVSAETSNSASSLLQPFVDKHELAGAIALVANKDKILSLDTVGFADIANKKAMDSNATFWIASPTPFLPHVFRPNSFFTDFPLKANS